MLALSLIAVLALASLFLPRRIVVGWLFPLAAIVPPKWVPSVSSLALEPLLIVVLVYAVRISVSNVLVRSTSAPDFAPRERSNPVRWVVLAFVLIVAIYLVAFPATSGNFSSSYRLVIEITLASFLTYLSLKNDESRFTDIRNGWTAILAVAVPLAFIEWVTGNFLFGADLGIFHEVARDGHARAQAFFPHPIIFGIACVLVAIWWIFSEGSKRVRFFIAAVLVVGAITSGSRGPELALVVAIAIVMSLRGLRSTAGRVLLIVAILAGTFLYTFTFSDQSTYVGGANESDTSTEYRGALLSVGISALLQHPLGVGPGKLPSGLLLVPSKFGVIDLTTSVDNAYLLLALQFGVVALVAALVVVAVVFTRGLRLKDSLNWRTAIASTIAVLVGAGTVAIQSWPIACLFLAQILAMTFSLRESSQPSVRNLGAVPADEMSH